VKDMEPNLVNDPALSEVLRELIRREPLFHHPELGTTRRDFESMTAEDFWEVGASGRRYSRDYVLGVLAGRHDGNQPIDVWSATDFHCRRLGQDVYLLTYTLFQGERTTRRSTIWQQTPRGWQAVFHQGTIVED
jgi:hypothetical protein